MSITHFTYPEFAHAEMARRLREAEQERQRRMLRHHAASGRRSDSTQH